MKRSTLKSFGAFTLAMAVYFFISLFLRKSNGPITLIFLLVASSWIILKSTLRNRLVEVLNNGAILVLYIVAIVGFGENYGWKGSLGCLFLFPVIFFLLVFMVRSLFLWNSETD